MSYTLTVTTSDIAKLLSSRFWQTLARFPIRCCHRWLTSRAPVRTLVQFAASSLPKLSQCIVRTVATTPSPPNGKQFAEVRTVASRLRRRRYGTASRFSARNTVLTNCRGPSRTRMAQWNPFRLHGSCRRRRFFSLPWLGTDGPEGQLAKSAPVVSSRTTA
jgi:hypothetical protein